LRAAVRPTRRRDGSDVHTPLPLFQI
jgi:hypothetical protein